MIFIEITLFVICGSFQEDIFYISPYLYRTFLSNNGQYMSVASYMSGFVANDLSGLGRSPLEETDEAVILCNVVNASSGGS
jgi:hypothetical protein